MLYYNSAQKAVSEGDMTWSKIRESTNDEWYALSQMKFEDPADGVDNIVASASSPPFPRAPRVLSQRAEYDKLYDRCACSLLPL